MLSRSGHLEEAREMLYLFRGNLSHGGEVAAAREAIGGGGFSLPVALQSALGTSHWPDLARIQLSWEHGKQSPQNQPPETEHTEREGIRMEGKYPGLFKDTHILVSWELPSRQKRKQVFV